MITLDLLLSDHHGAGREALQILCDYADLTSQVILLSADSHISTLGYEGSPEKDEALVALYTSFGFTSSIKEYLWEGEPHTKNIMERHPNVHPATVHVR